MRTIFADETLDLERWRKEKSYLTFDPHGVFTVLYRRGIRLTKLAVDLAALAEDKNVFLAAIAARGFDD